MRLLRGLRKIILHGLLYLGALFIGLCIAGVVVIIALL